jgi:hypothetical protein
MMNLAFFPTWSKDETDSLGQRFELYEGLSAEEIERRYCSETGIWRSFPGLRSKLYTLGLGHLSHKKRRCPDKAEITSTSVEQAAFSLTRSHEAISRIKTISDSMESHYAKADVESSESCSEDTQGDGAGTSFRQPSEDVADTVDSNDSTGDSTDEGLKTCSSPIQSEQPSQETSNGFFVMDDMYGLPKRLELPGMPEALGERFKYFIFAFEFNYS